LINIVVIGNPFQISDGVQIESAAAIEIVLELELGT